jgi:hypothetical protein
VAAGDAAVDSPPGAPFPRTVDQQCFGDAQKAAPFVPIAAGQILAQLRASGERIRPLGLLAAAVALVDTVPELDGELVVDDARYEAAIRALRPVSRQFGEFAARSVAAGAAAVAAAATAAELVFPPSQ